MQTEKKNNNINTLYGMMVRVYNVIYIVKQKL